MPNSQDIVAQFPDPIVDIRRLGGHEGQDYTFRPRYVATIPQDDDYFIHTRATIPLKDLKHGVGFGLWVKIDPSDFDLYLRAEKDDNLYKRFSCVGSLANTWPGFPDTLGDQVRVRTIHADEKVYITEYLSEPKDVLMRQSLLAQVDDTETKEYVRNLAMSYMVEMQEFADASRSQNFFAS